MMFQPLNESMPRSLPCTVEQVVEVLYDDISLRDRVVIAKLSEDDLDTSIYNVMARTIREEFALYNGNTELLFSCCQYISSTYGADEDPVMVIIKELWKKAKTINTLHLVNSSEKQAAAN